MSQRLKPLPIVRSEANVKDVSREVSALYHLGGDTVTLPLKVSKIITQYDKMLASVQVLLLETTEATAGKIWPGI